MSILKLIAVLASLCMCAVMGDGPEISVYPPVLTAANRTVTVSWSGVVNATSKDRVLIYSPSSQKVEDALGAFYVTESPTYSQGYGSVVLPFLVNMRTDYVFRLASCYNVTNCTYTILATSNTVQFDNPYAPAHAHLAFTQDSSALVLMWVSGDNSSSSFVEYGTDDTFGTTSNSTTTTYTMNQMCDAPANTTQGWLDPGFIHTAYISGLSPATTYYYRFGTSDNSKGGMSETFSFISPVKQSPNEEIYVIAFGDLGVSVPFDIESDQQYPATQTMHWVNRDISLPGAISPFSHIAKHHKSETSPPPWSLVHIGDISYARGYAFLWDWWFDLIKPVAAQVPWMVCIGNHEYDYTAMTWKGADDYGNDSGGECGVAYNSRFHMPGADNYARNLWYSYNHGPVHFVFMSTEHKFVAGSDQFMWILNDLASVDREATPFIVFSGHRPSYTSSDHQGDTEYELIRATYEPLWTKYKVNLCMWGHVHAYERTCGMEDYQCLPEDKGPVHVVIGMAGNQYQVPWTMWDSKTGSGHSVQPEWVIFRTQNYGYTRFFANRTHLNFQFLGDSRGELHDEFWLTPY